MLQDWPNEHAFSGSSMQPDWKKVLDLSSSTNVAQRNAAAELGISGDARPPPDRSQILAGLRVQQDVQDVFVLCAYFHAGDVYFYCILYNLAVQAHHLRRRCQFVHPDARQIRLALGGARRGSRQVNLSVTRHR